ncbi:MAG: hypothetical protein QOI02_1665 [Actinomycetota bacterium]|nr:hypothetical protein [Actinomycetota bacterium]
MPDQTEPIDPATRPIAPITTPINSRSGNAQTRPLPVVHPVEVAPRRKRRGWLGVVVALVILVALVVAAFFIAEPFVRTYAEKQVRTQVIQALKLPPTTVVNVDLGSGSLILQALTGRINDVRVSLPKLTMGGLTGSAVLTAKGVPLDSSQEVNALTIRVAVPQKALQSIASNVQGSTKPTVTLGAGVAKIATTYSLFGVSVPLAIDIKPSADAGRLKFTPENFYVNGGKVSLSDVEKSPIGGLVGSALGGTSLCVAQDLPKSFVLSKATVISKEVVLTVTGNHAKLNGKDLAVRGTCK